MIKLFGIKNCRSCHNARKWLDVADVEYEFVDLREDGVDREQLQSWLDTHGAGRLVNKRSTTWREMDTKEREACENDPVAGLMGRPTLIKRPILETGSTSLLGFSIVEYEAAQIRGG